MQTIYPSLSDRVQSMMIDALFLVALMFIAARILDGYESVPDGVRIGIFIFLAAIYEPLFVATGCTLGQLVKGLRVRQQKDESKKINLVQSFLRYLVKYFLGFVSFFTIHSNEQRRAIHDLASGSVMISVN